MEMDNTDRELNEAYRPQSNSRIRPSARKRARKAVTQGYTYTNTVQPTVELAFANAVATARANPTEPGRSIRSCRATPSQSQGKNLNQSQSQGLESPNSIASSLDEEL